MSKDDRFLERSGDGKYPDGSTIERIDYEPDHDTRAVVKQIRSQKTLPIPC